MLQRKRLLITISISFSIRYIIRTGLLEMLAKLCEPVIVITWNEEDLISELKAKGFEVHVLPELPANDVYENVRKKIDIWFKHFRLRNFYPNIERDYLEQFLPLNVRIKKRVREFYNIAKLYLPFYKTKLFKREAQLLHEYSAYKIMYDFVLALKPETVFTVTPFHRQEDILLRICKELKLPMITSILSFDNITKRGWIPVSYDEYMVWNKYNKAELEAIYPKATHEKIQITGAPQFDFYFNDKYLMNKNDWHLKYNFKEEQKIILYAGGPAALFPNEPLYLKQIDEAIKAGKIIGSPVVLFRCHPIDNIERWKKMVGESKNIVYDYSWTGTKNLGSSNITETDIRKLCSTLAYTDVHVNLCSTMSIDGSVFNKPQIGPAYDDVNKDGEHLLQQLYRQQHFNPIVKSNAIRLVKSKEQLIDALNDALEKKVKNDKQNVLQKIITYTDGKSTERVAAIIKDFITAN